MDYEIQITVDTNDADYLTRISKIAKKDLDKIRPLIEAIKNFKPYKATSVHSKITYTHDHNYPYGDCLREDMGDKKPEELYNFNKETFEILNELLPYDNDGFHTIESIVVFPVVEKEKLL